MRSFVTQGVRGALMIWLLVGLGLPVAAVAPDSPVALMRATTERLLADLAQSTRSGDDQRARRRLVGQHVSKHVDFAGIARRVLGKHWRRANTDQRTRFRAELQRMVLGSLAELLADESASIDFGAVRARANAKRVLVHSTLRSDSRGALDVRFRLTEEADGWKLYDVVIEGVSMVTTYRAAFDGEIRAKGMDALIANLVAKNEGAERGGS